MNPIFENEYPYPIHCIKAGVYIDNGISGTLVDRPAFQEMLTACRNGKIDLVVTKSVTRFARNTVVLLETIRELKDLEIDCYFEKEHMHSISSDGELFLTLLAMYAEEEARSASENQRWRIQKKYEQGIPVSGHTFGYKLKAGRFEIVPDEAEVVKRIFEMYLSGLGYTKIAKTLNIEGEISPKGNGWSMYSIRGILMNEKYAGNLILQKYFVEDFRTKKQLKNHGERRKYFVENSHEPIVSQEDFDAVQAEIERRSKKYSYYPGSNKRNHLFSGMIRCGFCDHIFMFAHNKERAIYRCPIYNTMGAKFCPSGQIPEDILIEKTKDVLGTDELSAELLEEKLAIIIIPEHKRIEYRFKDGTVEECSWDYVSRSKSWTKEMKRTARERYKGKPRGGKEES